MQSIYPKISHIDSSSRKEKRAITFLTATNQASMFITMMARKRNILPFHEKMTLNFKYFTKKEYYSMSSHFGGNHSPILTTNVRIQNYENK